MSVRNVRFYTTKGLVPPPIRRGRSGYYSADHVARLELVQELQATASRCRRSSGTSRHPRRRHARGHRAAAHHARAVAGRPAGGRCPAPSWTSGPTGGSADEDLETSTRSASSPRPAVTATRWRVSQLSVGSGCSTSASRSRRRRAARRGLHRARPGDRPGALRRVPPDGVACATRSPALPRRRSRRWWSGSSRCRSRAWSRRTKRAWTRPAARTSPPGPNGQAISGSCQNSRWSTHSSRYPTPVV